tara:strand:+ start:420 stop:908 length:489 start_codon:yes stop_codon:yes gene_type:complete
MSGIIASAGTKSGVISRLGTQAGTCYFVGANSSLSGTGWTSPAGDTVVPLNSIEVDTDGCCSVSGGTVRFTAPTEGVYLFGAHIFTADNDTGNYFGFYINGSVTNFNFDTDYQVAFAVSDADKILVFSHVYELNATDYVEVRAVSQSDVYHGNTHWWGCRLR